MSAVEVWTLHDAGELVGVYDSPGVAEADYSRRAELAAIAGRRGVTYGDRWTCLGDVGRPLAELLDSDEGDWVRQVWERAEAGGGPGRAWVRLGHDLRGRPYVIVGAAIVGELVRQVGDWTVPGRPPAEGFVPSDLTTSGAIWEGAK